MNVARLKARTAQFTCSWLCHCSPPVTSLLGTADLLGPVALVAAPVLGYAAAGLRAVEHSLGLGGRPGDRLAALLAGLDARRWRWLTLQQLVGDVGSGLVEDLRPAVLVILWLRLSPQCQPLPIDRRCHAAVV